MTSQRERGALAARLPWCAAVFGAALVVRMLHLGSLSEAPFFELRLGDAESYHRWATSLASGNWLGDEVFYQAPLYPYFLGAIYSVLGDDKLVVVVLQALLGAFASVLVCLAGWRLFGRRAGVIAGVALTLYAPAIFYESLIQKSVLDLFWLGALLWITSELLAEPRRWLGLALGLALGCLILTRENALVWVAPFLLWLAVDRSLGGRERIALGGLFVAGLLTVLAPVALRNHLVGGELHLTTSQLGPNLYIGNHPGAKGTYESLRPRRGDARYERQDATEIAEEALGRELTPGEVSSFFVERVIDYVRDEPLDWARLMARKWVLLWNAVEITDTEDLDTYAGWSPLLRWTGRVFHFGILAPLAALGLALTWPRRSELWLLYVMVLVYAASVVIFYVFGRYRFPMAPLLILFAAVALEGLRPFLRSRTPLSLPLGLGVTIGVAVFCNWPVMDRDEMRALTHFNFGTGFDERGDTEEAVRQYRLALALDPSYPEAHGNLGEILFRQGKLESARDHLERAVTLEPDYAEAHNNLGNLLMEKGALSEAESHLRAAIRHRAEHDAKPHYNLGNVLLRRGDLEAAAAQYEIAIDIDPGYAKAHYNLANVLFRRGELGEAAAQYQRTLRVDPNYAEAHHNLGIVYATQGRMDRAVVEFENALRIDPDYAEARKNLERARQAARER